MEDLDSAVLCLQLLVFVGKSISFPKSGWNIIGCCEVAIVYQHFSVVVKGGFFFFFLKLPVSKEKSPDVVGLESSMCYSAASGLKIKSMGIMLCSGDLIAGGGQAET